ncbi:peptidylprolyl isomerase [Xanthobacter sp. ZOL 2024]
MKRSVSTAALAAALVSSVALFSVSGPALAQSAAAKPAAAKPDSAKTDASKPADTDLVVATVNGTPIYASQLAIAAEDIGPGLPPQLQGPARRDYVLSFLTDMTLLAQAAEAQKLDQTPAFQTTLNYLKTKALMEALMTQAAKGAVTDELKRKTYDEFVKSQPPEEEVHARHILVDDEAKAKEIAKKAKAGEDFAKLAKEYSKDGADDGGDLGYFTKDQMVPEFAEVAFKLDKGQISDPVKSQFGWHIIKVEDKRTKPVPTYAQVEGQLDQYLVRKAQADLVTKLRADAKIEKAAAPATPGAAATPAPAAAGK